MGLNQDQKELRNQQENLIGVKEITRILLKIIHL